jgi:hypothetical protein
MGEAKRKRERLRAMMIKKTQDWMLPATDFEADLAKSILDLPVRRVPRLDSAAIAYMRMPANECHANVGWYARNDPTGQSVQVTGWTVEWPDFTLHSVLRRGSELMCITPNAVMGGEIAFKQDERINWVEDAEHYSPRIDGLEVPSNIRMFPEFTIARSQFVLRQLERVKNPYDALEIPMDVFDEMIRLHVPEEYWPESLAA